MNKAAPQEDESDQYLRRLSRLIRFLLQKKWSSPLDLWRFQTDLLKLQCDIQASISVIKADQVCTEESRAELEALRYSRAHARRLGDALAWIVLGMDRQIIYPLADNALVPVSPDDHGARGAIGMAGVLSQEGWGFPLLHDISDCLRIGDMTFIKSGRKPVTVEIKSRHVKQKPDADGNVVDVYEATVIGVSEEAPFPKPRSESRPSPTLKPTPRLKRQVKRMDTALAHQTAEPGFSTIDNEPILTIRMDRTSDDQAIKALQQVARRARRTGFATKVVDETFVYAAAYSHDPKGLPDLLRDVPKSLVDSGIFYTDRTERNSLVIYTTPVKESHWPSLYLPYFLLDLPVATKVDMLCGRMVVFNFVNSGRIVEAIEGEGFEVTVPNNRNDLANGSLVVSSRYERGDGTVYAGEIHNLALHVNEMVMEFRSLQYLIDILKSMRLSMEQQFVAPLTPSVGG